MARSRSTVAFSLAVLGNLIPVIWFTFLPTRDGPAHAFNAGLIRSLIAGQADVAATIVRWNPSPVPNWLGHAFMALVGAVVGPFVAERLLLATIVLSWPLALRYALRSLTRVETGLEFLAIPLVWGTHLHWGFYNFLLGVSAYLVSSGYWFRHRGAVGGRQLVCWSAMLIATYLASAQAVIQTIAFAVLVTLFMDRSVRARAGRATVVAAVPATCLFALFVLFRPHVDEPPTAFPSARWAAASLFRLDIMRGVDSTDRWVTPVAALALGVLIGIVCVRRWRESRPTLVWILALGITADIAALFLAPTTGGGGTLLTPRQAVFTVLMIVLCLGADPARLPAWSTIAGVSVALALTLHVCRWPFYARYDAAMRDFLEGAPVMPDGQVLFAAPLDCDHPGPDPESSLPCLSGHAGAYVALARHAVLANDYELQTGHFPLVASQPVHDGRHSWAGGRALDAVLLWRGSLDDRRRVARQLFASRPVACEIESGSSVPTTLFLADCAAQR